MANEICEIKDCDKVIGVGDFFIGHHPRCKEHKTTVQE